MSFESSILKKLSKVSIDINNTNYEVNTIIYYCIVLFFLGSLHALSLSYDILAIFSILAFTGSSIIFYKSKNIFHSLFMAISYSFGTAIFGLYWIMFSVNYIINNHYISLLVFIGFCFLYSIFAIFTASIFLLFPKKKNIFIITIFMAWALSEILKYYVLGGFPWLIWALVWNFDIYLQQLAYLIGSFGVSVLTIFCFSLSSILFIKNFSKKTKFMVIGLLLIILFVSHLYGYIRLNNNINHKNYTTLRLVNTNIPQDIKFDIRHIQKNFFNLINQTFLDIDYENPPKYIILPETIIPFSIEHNDKYYQKLVSKLPKKSYLIFGAIKKEEKKLYNVIYVISGETKKIIACYYKNRLVPFGEYLPIISSFPALQKILGLENNYINSSSVHAIFNIRDHEFVFPMICFEGIFPVKRNKYGNISWLLNISNEAWFNNSIENKQYISLLRYRSIEQSAPLVKVANSGISVVFDSYGRIVFTHNVDDSLYPTNIKLVY